MIRLLGVHSGFWCALTRSIGTHGHPFHHFQRQLRQLHWSIGFAPREDRVQLLGSIRLRQGLQHGFLMRFFPQPGALATSSGPAAAATILSLTEWG